jgi:hypothetical protein
MMVMIYSILHIAKVRLARDEQHVSLGEAQETDGTEKTTRHRSRSGSDT